MTGTNDARLPVLIVAGFLGSGKTSLLRAALLRSDLKRTLVIVNEVASQGVDDRLLATTGEPVVLLDNGCLCCSANDDLGRALLRIAENESLLGAVDRIVIETSGLADPTPALAALARAGQVSSRMRLQAIVTLVDAMHAREQLHESPEFALQLQAADRVLVSKLDLPGAAPLESVRGLIGQVNPAVAAEPADPQAFAAWVRRGRHERADQIVSQWIPVSGAPDGADLRLARLRQPRGLVADDRHHGSARHARHRLSEFRCDPRIPAHHRGRLQAQLGVDGARYSTTRRRAF